MSVVLVKSKLQSIFILTKAGETRTGPKLDEILSRTALFPNGIPIVIKALFDPHIAFSKNRLTPNYHKKFDKQAINVSLRVKMRLQLTKKLLM